jgi:hypothetical protein
VGPGTAGRPGSGPTQPPRRWERCPPEQTRNFIKSFSLCTYMIPVKVISWIRIRIRITWQMTSQNVWNMSLFEHLFKVLSLYLETRVRIRITVKVKIRIRMPIKVMRIRNTASRVPTHVNASL